MIIQMSAHKILAWSLFYWPVYFSIACFMISNAGFTHWHDVPTKCHCRRKLRNTRLKCRNPAGGRTSVTTWVPLKCYVALTVQSLGKRQGWNIARNRRTTNSHRDLFWNPDRRDKIVVTFQVILCNQKVKTQWRCRGAVSPRGRLWAIYVNCSWSEPMALT